MKKTILWLAVALLSVRMSIAEVVKSFPGLSLTGINNNGIVVGTIPLEGSVIVDVLSGTGAILNLPNPNGVIAGRTGRIDVIKINDLGTVAGLGYLFGTDGSVIKRGAVFGNIGKMQWVNLTEFKNKRLMTFLVNKSSDIAGTWMENPDAPAEEVIFHSFYRLNSNKIVKELVSPFGKIHEVVDFNDNKDVLGNLEGGVSGFFRAKNGVYTEIEFPGAVGTVCRGMNNTGGIVGYYAIPTGEIGEMGEVITERHGFSFINGVFVNVDVGSGTELQDINDIGQMVGISFDGSFVILP